MKRSQLHRYTPLRSKAPLRPRSRKRHRQDTQDAAALECFALEHDRCWRCGCYDSPWNPLDIHHAAGRNHPRRNHRANLIRVCRKDHEEIHAMPHALEYCLALKWLKDFVHFDSQLVGAIRGRLVDLAEVVRQVELLRSER